MRILLEKAEPSDTLLGAETLGLRNWMKEGKKREFTTCKVLLGFGGTSPLVASKSSTVAKKFYADVSKRMRMAKMGHSKLCLGWSSIGPTLKR
jgi:hypothetical protein